MKKFATLGFALMATATMAAAESADTLTVKATDVVLIETPTGVSVTMKGADGNPDYNYTFNANYPDGTTVSTKEENDFNFDFPFSKKNRQNKKNRFSVMVGPIFAGFVGGLDVPAEAKVDMGRSFEFGFHNLFALKYTLAGSRTAFSLGFGFIGKELVGKNGPMYLMSPDKTVTTGAFPEESHDRFSKIRAVYVTFPLSAYQWLGGKWMMMASASLEVQTLCNVMHSYKIGDEEYSYKWSNAPGKTVGYSLMGAIGNDGFGIYCKWSPTSIIKKGFGPQFGTISVGLELGI